MTSSTMCEVYLAREVHGALSGSPMRAEWSRPPTASNNYRAGPPLSSQHELPPALRPSGRAVSTGRRRGAMEMSSGTLPRRP